MKNILFLVTFLASLFTSLNTDAQCPNNNSPYGTISSLAPGQTSTVYCMYGGEYATVSVVSGAQYTFSTCGGSWDSQLTLRTTTGTYLAYNDDGCGLQSQINWTATFSGQVRVILDRYYCSNYNSCMNLNVTRGAPPAANPCNSISSLSCGTTGSFSLSSGSGSWNPTSGPWGTPGKEKVFSFTPALSGSHSIAVTNSSGWVDLFYKSGSCGSTGWTYVSDILSSETNSVTLTAGVTYYFLIDDENTSASSGTITVNCPTPAADPCNSITNIAACGSSSSFSLSSGTGSWNPPGPWGTPGKEAVFSYTPPVTGAYPITVTNSAGYVDVFYKTGSCSSAGWTYVNDIYTNETNTVNLTAGVTYLFLIDDENTSASSGTITIDCPCIAPPGGVDDSYTYNGDFTISGTTVGACNDCSLRPSNDRVYAVNISCAGDYTFATCGSSFDTYLYLSTAACGGSSIAINDDACGLQSSVTANLQPGTYYIHVEGFSSTSEGAFTMYVSGTGSAPSITGSATNATCFGASNGSITANVNGNGNTASATLNGASFNGSASGLAAGSYTLSASNCWGTSSQTFTVGQPTPLVATISSTAPNTTVCNGGTAPLTASVSGGSGTVNYQWQYQNNFGNWVNVSGWSATNVSTPFTNSRNASPSTTRVYRIVVTSSQNSQCTVTATQLVTVIPDPVFTITSTNVTCNGLNNGTATAVLTGGLPLNYGYNWFSNDGNSNNNNPSGDGTLSVSGLFPAEWVINTTVSGSSFGCYAQASVFITQPDVLVASSSADEILCNGGTVAVSVVAVGGTAPYSGEGNYTVGAGTYSYTVTDANGCTSTTSITVNEPALLTVNAGGDETVFYGYGPMQCAELSAVGAGGTPDYNYSWSSTLSGGAIGSDVTVCPETNEVYTVTITDANGCSASDQLSICVVNVECEAGNSGNMKVEMCQIPPGNPNNAHTICIDASAVPAHLAIGCTLGACGELDNCNYISGMAVQNMALKGIAMSSEIAFTAYPNPTRTETTISLTSVAKGDYIVVMTDVTGRVIETIYNGFMNDYENMTFNVDMNSLTSGIYFVNVIGSNGIMNNLKIVKE